MTLVLLCIVPAATDLAAQGKGGNKGQETSSEEDVFKSMSLPPRAKRQQSKPKTYLPDCTHPKDHDQADLCEQIRMADAAKESERIAHKQYVVGLIGAVLSFIGLGAILASLHFTRKATEAANQQVRLSRHALVDTDRAFVFPKTTEWSALVDVKTSRVISWRISVRWENSGNTPTRYLNQVMNMQSRSDELPEDFDFPDLRRRDLVPTMIAPHNTIESGQMILDPAILQAIIDGREHFYTWGWAEYDDVYERTPRHRTEFCHKWTLTGDPNNAARLSTRYLLHPKHNGADEECMKPVSTGSPKNPLPVAPE